MFVSEAGQMRAVRRVRSFAAVRSQPATFESQDQTSIQKNYQVQILWQGPVCTEEAL